MCPLYEERVMRRFEIVDLSAEYRLWARDLLRERWGSEVLVTRGKIHNGSGLPGFVAILEGEPIGLATYRIHDDQCEMVSLDSLMEGVGVGSALIEAVIGEARERGCRRLWLITTNDNLDAVHFYQKRGFHLVAVHRNALEDTRRLKPSLPRNGIDGIPLRDEIELEIPL
jgi:GNAT superfamily N-acetyltransferase